MNPRRIITSSAPLATLFATLLTVTGCSMNPQSPATTALAATLSAASEVPATRSAGSGSAAVQLNPGSNQVTWTVTYSGMSGPVTAAHFHGPAVTGQNAGVVVPFSGSMASPITGSATLTPAQMADLMAGKWYVNLHTAANPGGEIRGQVMLRP